MRKIGGKVGSRVHPVVRSNARTYPCQQLAGMARALEWTLEPVAGKWLFHRFLSLPRQLLTEEKKRLESKLLAMEEDSEELQVELEQVNAQLRKATMQVCD